MAWGGIKKQRSYRQVQMGKKQKYTGNKIWYTKAESCFYATTNKLFIND
jgi:hypothetical protein